MINEKHKFSLIKTYKNQNEYLLDQLRIYSLTVEIVNTYGMQFDGWFSKAYDLFGDLFNHGLIESRSLNSVSTACVFELFNCTLRLIYIWKF